MDNRASKVFLYLAIEEELSKILPNLSDSLEKPVLIDVAAGGLKNARLARGVDYVGFDIDSARISNGFRKENLNRLAFFTCNLFDISSVVSPHLLGDVVLCTETINVNILFDANRARKTAEALIALTASGGVCIFNVGNFSRPYADIVYEMSPVLSDAFETIKVIPYGSFFTKNRIPGWRFVNVFLARLQLRFPKVRTGFGLFNKMAIVICERRIPNDAQL